MKNNAGFFITFIILILFFLLFLYRIFKGNEKIKEQLDEFKKEIALKNERNLKEMPSDPPDDNNSWTLKWNMYNNSYTLSRGKLEY